jgi:hypothetical protein
MTKKEALPLLAMPGFLILSYGLDVAIATIKAFASSTFRVIDAAWGHVLVEFVFAGAVILLVWLVLAKREKKLLVGWLFFAIGLIALFISTPFQIYLSAIMSAPPAPLRGGFYYFLLSFGFYGFFTKASALIVVLGLVNLLRKPR